MEIWKDIAGYEGYYQVSNEGRVKRFSKNKVLATNITPYCSVSLSKKNIKKPFLVHRLVAVAFIPNPTNKPVVNHKDGNKRNNHIDNLEWNDQSENCTHAYRNGLSKVSDKRKASLSKTHSGANHYNSQSVINKVTKQVYPTIREAAKENNIPVQSLHRWLHQGKKDLNLQFNNQ